MPMPKVLYTDSIGTLVEYMPNKDSDTPVSYTHLTLPTNSLV